MQYPTLSRSTVRHLEVVALAPARLMLVLITDTGRVDQRVVDLRDVLTDDDVAAPARPAQRPCSPGSRSPTPPRPLSRPCPRT